MEMLLLYIFDTKRTRVPVEAFSFITSIVRKACDISVCTLSFAALSLLRKAIGINELIRGVIIKLYSVNLCIWIAEII